MTLDENTGEIISQEQAKLLIKAFGEKFKGEVTSSFIGKNNITRILNQGECIGLRIYNGYNIEEEKISIVIVGVGKEGNDLLNEGLIYDKVLTCPPICPDKNTLIK
jgi:hypothetical protein